MLETVAFYSNASRMREKGRMRDCLGLFGNPPRLFVACFHSASGDEFNGMRIKLELARNGQAPSQLRDEKHEAARAEDKSPDQVEIDPRAPQEAHPYPSVDDN